MKCTLKPQLHLGCGRTFLVFYRSSGMFDDPCNSLVNTWLALLLTQNGLMGAEWMDAWFCCKSSCDSIRKKAWSIYYTTSLSPKWKVKHHQEGSQFCFNKPLEQSQLLMEVVISVKTNGVLTSKPFKDEKEGWQKITRPISSHKGWTNNQLLLVYYWNSPILMFLCTFQFFAICNIWTMESQVAALALFP